MDSLRFVPSTYSRMQYELERHGTAGTEPSALGPVEPVFGQQQAQDKALLSVAGDEINLGRAALRKSF